MTNPTSNFGWQMPTATDLVTDLPADFEVFGQAVDTDFVDLLGGANGYILSKASATDLDFAWIPNDQGDITAVNVTAPITGGGSSGAVTIGVDAASTSASGVVQLSDSTSTTSSVLASTPTATKSAYDLAAAAVPKSTVTTAGDVIYATGSAAVTRLGIGTAGDVLTVAAGVPSWAAPAGGAVVQVKQATTSTAVTSTSGTYADTGLTVDITPTSASNKILVMVSQYCFCDNPVSVYESAVKLRLNRGATAIYNDGKFAWYNYKGGGTSQTTGITINYTYLDSPATTSTTTYKTQFAFYAGTATVNRDSNAATITVMEVTP